MIKDLENSVINPKLVLENGKKRSMLSPFRKAINRSVSLTGHVCDTEMYRNFRPFD